MLKFSNFPWFFNVFWQFSVEFTSSGFLFSIKKKLVGKSFLIAVSYNSYCVYSAFKSPQIIIFIATRLLTPTNPNRLWINISSKYLLQIYFFFWLIPWFNLGWTYHCGHILWESKYFFQVFHNSIWNILIIAWNFTSVQKSDNIF